MKPPRNPSLDHQSQFYGDVRRYLYDANNWDVFTNGRAL